MKSRCVLLSLMVLALAGSPLAASTMTIDGVALLDEALADATLSVQAPDGTVLADAAGRTNWAGRFTIDVPQNAGGYRILAKGGHTSRGDFHGTLSARVDAASAAKFVVLEPITTLADRYRAADDKATQQDAYHRVEKFLGIPADPGIEGVVWDDSLAVSSSYFDRSTFVDRAAGGFDAYVSSLVSEMQHGETESFIPSQKRPLLQGPADVAKDLAKDVAGKIGGLAVDALLEKTGILDKLGLAPEKVNVATREQVEALARSIEAVRSDLKRVSDQIASSTEPIANQVAELREFTAFTARNGSINDHVTVFETVKGDYANFITGNATAITATSLIAGDIDNKILGGSNDFRDRVNSIHSSIVPTSSVDGLVDGVYTLLAKVARENNKDWTVVENYFVKLTGWQTEAMGLYLDAKRYKKAPPSDIEALKRSFKDQLAAQRLELLKAAEVFVLYKGPRGLTGVPMVDLAPMRRADLIVHALEGKKGWATAALVGFSDPVADGLKDYAGPYMQVHATAEKHQFNATYGTGPKKYYQQNDVYDLAGQNCYYYVGRDFAERNSPTYFSKLAAGLACRARVMRYKASFEPTPFYPPFKVASSAIEDVDTAARAGQRPGDQAPPFGTIVTSRVDLVSGADSTTSSKDDVSLAGSVNAASGANSQFTLAGTTMDEALIYIPPTAITEAGTYLAPKCQGSAVRFGFDASTSPDTAFHFRRLNKATTCTNGNCPPPEAAFGFKCPGSTQERFLAAPAAEGGLATAGTQPFYFKLAAGNPKHRVRLTYPQGERTAALYLNIPTTIVFYGGLVGYDLVGKSRDVGAFRDGTRLSTNAGLLEKRDYSAVNETSSGEKDWSIRVLGSKPLDFDLNAIGALTGTLVRETEFNNTCVFLKPSLTGKFSHGDTEFAAKQFVAEGNCSGLVTTPVNETFSGTATVRGIGSGSTFKLKMRAEDNLSYRGGQGQAWHMSANGDLAATKLEVTIANPGNF